MSEEDLESTDVSEEVDETAVDEANEPDDFADHSVDDLKAMVKRYRKEAGDRRIANKRSEAELEEFRKWKKTNKSELETLKAEVEEYRTQAKAAAESERRREAAKSAKLPLKFAERLRGETEEELLEDAKALAAELKLQRLPGTSGKPVSAKANNEKDWFNALVRGN